MSRHSASPIPTDRCLLGLAEELQVFILLELHPADILACKRVCHALADVIERTPAVQYKLELALAGMVDGPARGVPVGKRLEKLRAYQASWRQNDIPLDIITLPYGGRCHLTDGVYVQDTTEGVTLIRPASAFSGTTADSTHVGFRQHLPDPDFEVAGCVVDRAQDLLVVTQLLLGEIPQLCIFSISQGGFHPLAAMPHYAGDSELSINVDPEETLQICGDLIAWTITTDTTELTVLNWKTGQVVWASGEWHDENPQYHLRCYFLDPTHLVVVENTILHVHEIDPNTLTPSAWHRASLCTLALPELAAGKGVHALDSAIGHPPIFPECPPLFAPDPAHTLLAVAFKTCADPLGYNTRIPCKHFLALVPVRVMLALAALALRQKASTTKSEGEPDPYALPTATAPVPWEEWSAGGARFLQLENKHGFDVDAVGARVMLMAHKKGQPCPEKDIYLLDARPLAQPALALAPDAPVRLAQRIEDPEFFVRPVRSTLPCRVARKEYVSRPPPDTLYMTGPPEIGQDGLLGLCSKLHPPQS